MAASQSEKDAYKMMRRGTYACRECRRRKIKCIYTEDDESTCQNCTAHGRRCTKQGLVRGSSLSNTQRHVKVKVTRFESAVEKLAREQKKLDEFLLDSANRAPEPDRIVRNLDASEIGLLDEHLKKRSPIFSLFDNELIHQKDVLKPYDAEFTTPIRLFDTNLTDKEKLLSTIANVPGIFHVLHYASDWWISWREQHFALRKAAGRISLHDFVQQKLADDNPSAIALGLMALAMALGQIRPGIDDLTFNLPVSANHIMNSILAGIDQVICDSTTYQEQPDVILLFMMRAKHHTENNQLRKAWLRIRQGIHCAQITGFGAPSLANSAVTEQGAEQQRFIASIFELDHLISMVLGFPHAKDPAFTDARALTVLANPSITDESLKMRALRRICAVTAARVNDRNARSLVDDNETDSIQVSLQMAASAMPQGWWDLLVQPLAGLAQHRYESLMTQLWYWMVQAYLHLPYLIKADIEASHSISRYLCMEGARNLLRSFNYLRTEPSISMYMCNCDDFLALMGGCILLVGVLQDVSRFADSPTHSVSDRFTSGSDQLGVDADLALIEDLKDVFRCRAQAQGGSISKQGLAVLEELSAFLYEDDRNDNPGLYGSRILSGMNMDLNKHEKAIMMPYFGTIKVELTKKLRKRRPTQVEKSMLTPPRSSDGSQMTSPQQHLTYEDSLLSINHGRDLYSDISTTAPALTQEAQTTRNKNDCTICPAASGLECPINSTDVEPIAWDCWDNYMFDSELNQDWNPNLTWNDDWLQSPT